MDWHMFLEEKREREREGGEKEKEIVREREGGR